MPIETRDILLKTLKSFWGYDAFRESQEEIILSILEQNDTLFKNVIFIRYFGFVV